MEMNTVTPGSSPKATTFKGFRQSNSCVLGQELWHWYCSTRSPKGGKLSRAMVQARAKWVFHQAGLIDFKASDGWYRRWMHRWRNSTTIFETENVVQAQQTDQTKQTDWGSSQPSSKHVKPEINETETTFSRNIQTDGKTLPSPSGYVCTEFIDTQNTVMDSPRDISGNSKSEEEMFDYWSTFLNCNTNFGNIDSDLTQNNMEFFNNSGDSNFAIDVDDFASVFMESHSQMVTDKSSKHHRLNDCRIHRKRGERYLPRFKEKVLSYISSHDIKTTAEKFRVHQETVSRWKKKRLIKNSMSAANTSSSNIKNGTDIVRMSADKQLLAWLRRCRVRQISFTAEELQNKVGQFIAKSNSDANPRWFLMWVERFGKEEIYEEGIGFLDPKKKRNIQYPEAFKREVASYAENKSQISVAKLFHVPRRRIFDWVHIFGQPSKEGNLTSEENDGHNDGKKKKKTLSWITDPEIDQQLWTWYQTQAPKPSSKEVRAKGVELYHAKGHTGMQCSHGWYRRWCTRYNMVLCHGADDQILQWALTQLEANQTLTHQNLQVYALKVLQNKRAGFKASTGWVLRFCRRHPNLLQFPPKLTTPLPTPLLLKVSRFRQLIQSIVLTLNLTPEVIGNVDELHISFSSHMNGPDTSVKKQLLLRKSTMEKCHFTVILACLADGNMLPPTIILKGNPNDSSPEVMNSKLLVLYQDEAQLDELCMIRWLNEVWFRFVPVPNLIIADCFPPHCTASVKEMFVRHQSTLKVIPGGCTSKLQPLDVSITNTFQNLIEKQWNQVKTQRTSSLGVWDNVGKFEMPSRCNIVRWVNNAYENIQTTKQETIRRSYLVTGLTVSSNHSEDHFIDNFSMIPEDGD